MDAPSPQTSSSSVKAAGLGVIAAAALLAGSQLVSRVLGYGREMLIAGLEARSANADAYFSAFMLPDLLNHFLAGGALSIAFLPFYTQALNRGGEAEGRRVLSLVLGTLTTIGCVVTALLWLGAAPLVAWIFPDYPAEVQALTTELTRIVLPAQLCFLAGGVINAALFAQRRFGAAAIAPLIYNLCILVSGWALHSVLGMHGFAWGVLLGAALGPLGVPWLDARKRVPMGLRFAPRDPIFIGYVLVAAPLILGQTLLTADELFTRYFGAGIGEGAVAGINYARKLMLLPVAIIGQAIGTAALPMLTQLYEQNRIPDLNSLVLRTLQAALSLGLLLAPALALLAHPAVVLAYQRGQFTPGDTAQVTVLLQLLCIAVPSWVLQQIAVRPFYARSDTFRPMVLGTAVVILVVPVYWAFSESLGVIGLGIAASLAMTINAIATLLLARKLHGAPELGPLLGAGARALGVALLASVGAAVAIGLVFGIEVLHPSALLGATQSLQIGLLGGLTYAAIGLPAALWLGDPSLRAAVLRVVRVRQRAT